MANDEIVESLIRLKLDQSAAAGARQGIQGVKSDLASLGTAADTDIASTAKLADKIADVGKQAKASGGNLRSLLGATGQIAGSLIPGAGQAFGVAGAVTEVKAQFGTLKETIGGLSTGMKAAGAAGVAFGIALAILNQRFLEGKKAAAEELDARQRALELLRTGTKEQVQEQIKALETAKANREADAADANKFLADLRDGIKKNFGAAGLAIAEVNAKLGTGAPELAQAIENATNATKALGTTNTELDLLTQGLATNATAANDAAAGIKAASDALAAVTAQAYSYGEKAIDIEAATRSKIIQLRTNGSKEELDAARRDADARISDIYFRIDKETKLQQTFKLGSKEYDAATQRIQDLNAEQSAYVKSLIALEDATIDADIAANDAAKRLIEINHNIVDIYKSYQDDVLNITTKYNEDYATLEQKKADTVEQIQQEAVDSAAKLLDDLQQKQNDLRSELGRDLTDLANQQQQEQLQSQIEFQREEVRAEKKHQDDIERIRRQAQQDEFELSLDRDFAGLARSRRATANQINEIGIQAQKDRQARLDAYREKQQDDNSAFIAERQQRITQYQRSLEDAQLNYQREYRLAVQNKNRQLAAAQASYNTELAQLNSNLRKQLDTRYQAAQAEVSLAKQTTDTRVKTFQMEYEAAVRFFNLVSNGVGGTTGSGSGGGLKKRAFGGSLNAFAKASVNEGGSSGNESFRSGGKSAQFPSNTAGLFIPFNNGSVDKGEKQGMNITIPITIDAKGGDPAKIEAMLDSKLEGVVRRIFVNKAV